MTDIKEQVLGDDEAKKIIKESYPRLNEAINNLFDVAKDVYENTRMADVVKLIESDEDLVKENDKLNENLKRLSNLIF